MLPWAPNDTDIRSTWRVGRSFERSSISWGYLEINLFHVFTDRESLKHVDNVADHNPRVRRWLEFLGSHQYTVTHRKAISNGNADTPSRLLLPATEHDRSGKIGITLLDLAGVKLARSCSLQTYDSPTPGIDLGGLVSPASDIGWDTIPFVPEDFASENLQNFRAHGPRMKVKNLFASD